MKNTPYLNVLLPENGAGKAEKSPESSLKVSLPASDGVSGSHYTSRRVGWAGLNQNEYIDCGYLSDAEGISMSALPYLEPEAMFESVSTDYTQKKILSIHGFDTKLLVVYAELSGETYNIKLDVKDGAAKYTGTLKTGAAAAELLPRNIVQFNVYSSPTDPLSGTFVKKLLIFPDKLSIDYGVSADFTPASLGETFPNIKYAAVQESRLFGVDDGRIYASGFNDYANWDLDTASDVSSAHAWCSPTQADSRAGGNFTGICSYGGYIIAFKKDFTHELYNNKNPYYLQELFNYGSIDQRSVQEVGGKLIFVSSEGVVMYGGGAPALIDTQLAVSKYVKAISGSYRNVYYLATDSKTYTYNAENGQWSKYDNTGNYISFASNSNGFYAATETGLLKYKDVTIDHMDSWMLETDIQTGNSLDVKSLERIQLLADFEANSSLSVALYKDGAKYNSASENNPETVYTHTETSTGRTLRCIRIPFKQGMGYSHKLRFTGENYVRLHNLELVFRTGGKLYGES